MPGYSNSTQVDEGRKGCSFLSRDKNCTARTVVGGGGGEVAMWPELRLGGREKRRVKTTNGMAKKNTTKMTIYALSSSVEVSRRS